MLRRQKNQRARRDNMHDGTLLAAVDLGSNSFRLEIGRFEHGLIRRIEYLKETVRQGNGLDEDRNLTPDAMQRGWDCLARFAERLKGFPAERVRAVATRHCAKRATATPSCSAAAPCSATRSTSSPAPKRPA